MNELALFAGAGGGILGGHLLGWKTVCAVEIEDYPRKVLLQRQADGILPRFPVWDDITTFNGTSWKGRCDIVTGGFPCQDISAAGKGSGIDGQRSGLWSEMFRVVYEVGPRFVFVENSPILTIRGLHKVLGDLATVGYNARWCVLGADTCGAPHKRDRIWILAYTSKMGQQICKIKKPRGPLSRNWISFEEPLQYGMQPGTFRSDNELAHWVDRLKAIGNGQVPAVAAIAFIILSEGLI